MVLGVICDVENQHMMQNKGDKTLASKTESVWEHFPYPYLLFSKEHWELTSEPYSVLFIIYGISFLYIYGISFCKCMLID